MNYWWVNHNQTHTSEIEGGYIWSPKTETTATVCGELIKYVLLSTKLFGTNGLELKARARKTFVDEILTGTE